MTGEADTTRATLEELAAIVRELPSPLFARGSFAPKKPIAVRLADGVEVAFSRAADGEGTLKPLLARMRPAPFGAGTRTVVDPAVRRALQLEAAGGAFTVEGFDPEQSGVLDVVRRDLLGDPAAGLIAELDGINVYRQGDHFRAHKDTPRSADAIGTLVVCLPVRFVGGLFTLSRGMAEEEIDFSDAIEAARSPRAAHWVAFFGDVDHRIAPVLSGFRVTLTYALRGRAARRASEAPAERARVFTERLSRALGDPGFVPRGGVIRFPCAHLYPFEAEALPSRALDAAALAALKGRDRDVAAAGLAAGLPVALIASLVTGSGDMWPLTRLPTRKDIARLPAEITLDHVEPFTGLQEGVIEAPLDAGGAAPLFERVFSYNGFLGNEGAETTFYVASAIEMEIGGFDQRSSRGRRVTHPKFGAGEVVGVVAQGSERALKIRFGDGSERTILERFVKEG